MTEPGSDNLQSRRLALSALLSAQARRCAGAAVLAEDIDGSGLLRLASRLTSAVAVAQRAHGVRFEPVYPGTTRGVEEVAGGLRLLLACRVLAEDGTPIGVAFTSLIPGHPPYTSVAPSDAPIPAGRRSATA